MLSCEEASLLMTQKQFKKLSIKKWLQLKMHLLSCKLCRRFDVQNDIIHNEWNSFTLENAHLSNKKKKVIKSEIKSQLKETE